jgi:tetratricopeptide (TPR) repeat protein
VEHCQHIGQGARAVAALNQLLRFHPDDLQLQNELKQATATAAMEKDKWDQADSFREMVRDREKAERLEREERVATIQEEDVLEKMIAEAREDVDKAPSSVPFRRHLATLYVQAKQFDEAIEQYEEVLGILGREDPTIRDAITTAKAARYEDAIRRWREYADGNAARQEEAAREIEEIEKQKQAFLLECYAERVRKYPNEHTYHFDYGQMCFEMGDFDTALKEFQFARQNRHLHVRCLVYIGRCMAAKGIDDLASQQLEMALERGDQRMDRERLGIIYDLAVLYERLGQQDEYIRRLKEVYAVDVSFRDVAQRLEQTYSSTSVPKQMAAY